MDKIKDEHAEIMDKIKRFQEILNNEDLRLNLLVEDLKEVKEKYGDKICTYGFSPITARDTYIYRMLHYDPNSELDITLINKFGLNEGDECIAITEPE